MLVNLLEGDEADDVIRGLNIDTAWTAGIAGADAAAVLAAGTHIVASTYDGKPVYGVDAAAQAKADAINSVAAQHELANYDFAQQVLRANLDHVWDANIAHGQQAAADAVNAAALKVDSDMYQVGRAIYNEFNLGMFNNMVTNPSYRNFVDLGVNIGVQFAGPIEAS